MRIEKQLAVCKAKVLSSATSSMHGGANYKAGAEEAREHCPLDLQAMSGEEKDATLVALWGEIEVLKRRLGVRGGDESALSATAPRS
jgi:hypothetical protein